MGSLFFLSFAKIGTDDYLLIMEGGTRLMVYQLTE